LTEIESALNYKDCDTNYMFVHVPMFQKVVLNYDEQQIVSRYLSVLDSRFM